MQPQGGGNVYGKGGLDPRPPRRSLFMRMHPGMTAAVAAGVVAAFALGWIVWRSTSAPDPLRDLSEVTAEQTVASAAPAAAPSEEAEVELAAGARRLESLKNPGTVVSDVDGLAVITANGPALAVVAGLADPACFSFHTDDDRYMRHSGYRLRFDENDGTDLFRQDATFCPEDGAAPGTITLRSHNYPEHVVHHRNVDLWIDESDGSTAFARASSFIVHEG